jgi:hypothetical protein
MIPIRIFVLAFVVAFSIAFQWLTMGSQGGSFDGFWLSLKATIEMSIFAEIEVTKIIVNLFTFTATH